MPPPVGNPPRSIPAERHSKRKVADSGSTGSADGEEEDEASTVIHNIARQRKKTAQSTKPLADGSGAVAYGHGADSYCKLAKGSGSQEQYRIGRWFDATDGCF